MQGRTQGGVPGVPEPHPWKKHVPCFECVFFFTSFSTKTIPQNKAQNAPDCTDFNRFSKIFRGSMPPDPPSSRACSGFATSLICPPKKGGTPPLQLIWSGPGYVVVCMIAYM
ncbi:hypothetical protein V1264_011054 [Littorina saxatilis]|uniref:Uncharacterized protein n=1 Tax=Littorina saxatilis TaxID=31220 RepID=A0AAN9BU65_9CAEN